MRLRYGSATAFTIVLGLSSRHFAYLMPETINLWLGDALYAVMIYFIMAFLFPVRPPYFKAATALIFCFLIEVSQLYHSPAADAVRSTLFGSLVLGSGFLWSDLVAYTGGVLMALLSDLFFSVRRNRKTALRRF